MRRLRWTDRYTRAVFVEFTVYNAQVNLFVIVNLVAEFVDSAGIFTHYRVDPVNLLGQVRRNLGETLDQNWGKKITKNHFEYFRLDQLETLNWCVRSFLFSASSFSW